MEKARETSISHVFLVLLKENLYCTDFYELTDTAAHELDLQSDSSELIELKIDHLESSYNYRTIGDRYHVYTSGLSKNEICIPVETNSNIISLILDYLITF